MATWTNDEILILKEQYPKYGYQIPQLKEKYSPCAIRKKANALGIKCISKIGKRIVDPCGNEFPSIKAMCDFYKIPEHRFYNRRHAGLPYEECFEQKKIYKKYLDKDIKKAAELMGMTYSGFRKRMDKYGLTIEEAINMGTTTDIYHKMGKEKAAVQIIDHIGEVFRFKDGTWCEIIENAQYKNRNVTIRFNNGTIRKVRYCTLKQGYKPGGRDEKKDTIEGQRRLMNCGLYATVVEYISCRNILIRFEDGTETRAVYGNFVRGGVSHPTLSAHPRKWGTFYGFKTRYAFKDDSGNVWYKTIKDGEKNILTPQMMMEQSKNDL